MKNIVICDMSNMNHRCIHIAQKKYEEELQNIGTDVGPIRLIQIWKSILFNEILRYIELFKPDKFIFAQDGKDYWRKNVYSKYKENRAAIKKESKVDYDFFFPEADKFRNQLQSLMPNCHFLLIDRVEGDDIMAVLSREIFQNDNVILVSADKDLNQLLTNPKVTRYNPMSKEVDKFANVLNPKDELHEKIICGDPGDNIHNIFVLDEDRYPTTGRRIGLGPVTAEKILKEEKFLESDFVADKVSTKYSNLSSITIFEEVKANYERNLKLISFEFIPFDIKESVINSYNNYEVKPVDYVALNKLAMSLGDNEFSGRFSAYKKLLDNIK